MGRLVNLVFGLILIALGVLSYINFLAFIPYIEIIFPLVIIAVGYLVIRSSEVTILGAIGRPIENKRLKGLVLMGILIILLGIINGLTVFGIYIPYFDLRFGNIALIIFGLIIIILAFKRLNRKIGLAYQPHQT